MNSFEHTPQWKSGRTIADFLDTFFAAKGWIITPTTPYEERLLCLGDRHYCKASQHLLVEYKSDRQTAVTGNVFLETISVDSTHTPGWVYTCQADYIFYAALLNREILVFTPRRLRVMIDTLQTKFKTVKTGHKQNNGYATHGVIVPLGYAEKHLTDKIIAL